MYPAGWLPERDVFVWAHAAPPTTHSHHPLPSPMATTAADSNIKRTVAIVGKGVTFDSGGYNLKAGAGSMIELMKFDMGGAAATLGAAKAVSLLKPPGVAVHFLVPACENMVDGKGLRPGDVLTAANGKTVEVCESRQGACDVAVLCWCQCSQRIGQHQVVNTDAEGRLTMADALWYAEHKLNATAIVNIATLTGAMIVSLGTGIAGLFSPNDDIAERCACV